MNSQSKTWIGDDEYNKPKNNSFLTLRTTMALFLDHLIDEPKLEIEQSITIKAKETQW